MRFSFPAKAQAETITLAMDFLGVLSTGENISNAKVSILVYSGGDYYPENVLIGSTTFLGTIVKQAITGGVVGVTYIISCTIVTSLGNTFDGFGLLTINGQIVQGATTLPSTFESQSTASVAAQAAAVSASEAFSDATTALACAVYRTANSIAFADSPYTPGTGKSGTLFVVDTTGGGVTVNLPAISTLALPYNIGFKVGAGVNNIVIAANAADSLNGVVAATTTVVSVGNAIHLIATNTGWQTLNFGTGSAGGAVGPCAKLYLSANQSVANSTWAKVLLDSASFDTTSAFDATLHRYTPLIAGYYQLNASLELQGTTITNAAVSLYKNGAEDSRGDNSTSSAGNNASVNVSSIIFMNGSTDYIELYGFVTASSGDLFISGSPVSYMSAVLLGTVGNPGGNFSSNTSLSVDSEVVLFSGTGGHTGKRASGTGLAKLSAGVLGLAIAKTDYIGATSGSAMQKADGAGGLTAATSGSDYYLPGAALGTPSSGTLTNCTFPTLNQNTTGSAATWTTARLLGGNSTDGSTNVPFANKFIAQGLSDSGLSNGQFLGNLATGIVKNTTNTGVLTIAIAGDFPTLNQSTTGSAATLTTPRAIYGNNFDGSAALAQVIASTYGGTGNGFTKLSGPTTAEKTKTLRDATDTILELGGSYTPTGTWTSLTMVTPVLGTPTSGTLTNCTGLPIAGIASLGTNVATALAAAADGSVATAIGFKGMPQNSNSAAYTTVMADAGKHLLHPSADTTARTFTIDSNANVSYPIGTTVTFVNQASAGVLTIAITSDTMRLAGAGTTGSRTLAANGIATALKLTSTEWIINGTGLT